MFCQVKSENNERVQKFKLLFKEVINMFAMELKLCKEDIQDFKWARDKYEVVR